MPIINLTDMEAKVLEKGLEYLKKVAKEGDAFLALTKIEDKLRRSKQLEIKNEQELSEKAQSFCKLYQETYGKELMASIISYGTGTKRNNPQEMLAFYIDRNKNRRPIVAHHKDELLEVITYILGKINK